MRNLHIYLTFNNATAGLPALVTSFTIIMAFSLLLESRNAASSFSHPRLNLSHNTSVLNYSQVELNTSPKNRAMSPETLNYTGCNFTNSLMSIPATTGTHKYFEIAPISHFILNE